MACVTVVLVVLIVVGGLVAPTGVPDEEQDMPKPPPFCEQLRETDLNPIQKCRQGDSTQPVTVRL